MSRSQVTVYICIYLKLQYIYCHGIWQITKHKIKANQMRLIASLTPSPACYKTAPSCHGGVAWDVVPIVMVEYIIRILFCQVEPMCFKLLAKGQWTDRLRDSLVPQPSRCQRMGFNTPKAWVGCWRARFQRVQVWPWAPLRSIPGTIPKEMEKSRCLKCEENHS